MRRFVWLLVSLAAFGCKGQVCVDEAASVTLRLEGDLSAAQSIEVRVAYDEVSRTYPRNLVDTDTNAVVIGLIPPPKDTTSVTIEVAMYGAENARGSHVGGGAYTGDMTPDGCNDVVVSIEAGPPVGRDGGVVIGVDAGPPPPDAGPPQKDAGTPDAGVDGLCEQSPDAVTTMLYAFESLPDLIDGVDQTIARYIPLDAQGEPIPDQGPQGCGTAIAFGGEGVMEIEGEGLLLDEGALDFWVRFEGDVLAGQGIVSRDAVGQAEPGHFTVFRSCENRIVVRMQDPDSTAYRCSSEPVEVGTWVHVGINFGLPNLELYVDGIEQNQRQQVPVTGGGCQTLVDCGADSTVGFSANQLPLAVGASTHETAPGEPNRFTLPFTGSIDAIHLRSSRRAF